LPVGTTLSCQKIVCDSPFICIALGIYGELDWLIINVTAIALLLVVGTFVKLAVKLNGLALEYIINKNSDICKQRRLFKHQKL
jgi:hypothetical protein